MAKEHVNGAVEMHLLAFEGFFLSLLGRGFLREFYKAAVDSDQTVGFVAVDDNGDVLGACFGVIDSKAFYKDILKKRWFMFALKAAWPAIKKPKIIPRLLRALKHDGNIPPCDMTNVGALQSTAVSPEAQGIGLAIGIMRAVCDEYVKRGTDKVFLTTDADDNDMVRGFYEAMGWYLLGNYTTPEGRNMCWYMWENPDAK